MSSDFNFKQYQSLKVTWRMLVRLLIYSIVIGTLLYLIFGNKEEDTQNPSNSTIDQFDIDFESPESE